MTLKHLAPARKGHVCIGQVHPAAGLVSSSGIFQTLFLARSPQTPVAVASAAELVALVHGGLQLRERHPTLVHMASSRSHLVVTVTLTVVSPQTALESCYWRRPLPVDHTGSARQARAKLQLVDLAGSECAGASGVTGLALRETSFINRSLAALADVLGALSERRGHVPYRNSKLTHLFQDTIGGDAKLLVILCVSPGQKHVAETLQGLGFGARARQAERGQAGKRPSCAQKRIQQQLKKHVMTALRDGP
ncbi:kinesin-like protein KIF25 [Callospermophilus lateralis]|uniref:kinesin-like protein KIF25 n=1 Tax=Callospermophilus lateralis TaxID=76772 RepID=UPI00405413F6